MVQVNRTAIRAGAAIAVVLAVLAGCSKGDDEKQAQKPETSSVEEIAGAPSTAEVAAAEGQPPMPSELAFDAPAVARGKVLAEANCLRCHASKPGQASTHASAPSFATLFTNYPPDYIAEAFAEGVFVGHGDMPAYEFEPEEINDLVAFLKTLSPAPS